MLQFLIGFIIIGLIIWTNPFSDGFFNDLSYNQYLIITSLISVLLFTSFLLLELYKLYYPDLYRISEIAKISTMIQNAPSYVYEKLTERWDLRRFIEQPASYFTAYFAYPRAFVIMFYYLPQLVVATVFVVETIFFDQQVVFIKSLNLLIIFLLCRTIISIFKRDAIEQMAFIGLYVDVSMDGIGIGFVLRDPKDIRPGLEIDDINKKYTDMCNDWVLYYLIYNHMTDIEDFNNQYSRYIRIYTFFCYVIGCGYLFLYLLTLLY